MSAPTTAHAGVARVAWLCFFLGLALRLWQIASYPVNFSFDSYQRWGGREHLLIQVWLPTTQAILMASQWLGGLEAGRVAMSVVGAAAAAMGCALAGRLGGRPAAWLYFSTATLAPYMAWSTAFYQEGTFLLVLFAGLRLAVDNPRWGDVVIGLLGLVRYEGWPAVALYLLWRRDPRALVATWGMWVWLAIKLGIFAGVVPPPYKSSPVNLEDWAGLTTRFHLLRYLDDLLRFLRTGIYTGALLHLSLSLLLLPLSWRVRGVPLLGWILASQVAATLAWMAGLETATHRMWVIPGMLAGLIACVGVGARWERLPAWLQTGAALLTAYLFSVGWIGGRYISSNEQRYVRYELAALETMASCPTCRWWMEPRRGLGTRERHDGCEIIQGTSTLLHGREFWCGPWATAEEVRRFFPTVDGYVVWVKGRYVIGTFAGAPVQIDPDTFDANDASSDAPEGSD